MAGWQVRVCFTWVLLKGLLVAVHVYLGSDLEPVYDQHHHRADTQGLERDLCDPGNGVQEAWVVYDQGCLTSPLRAGTLACR